MASLAFNRLIKRVIDVSAAGMGLLVLSPVFLVVAVILKVTGEGEILFLQERMGFRNRPFRITKFATMVKSAAVMKDGDYTIQNDPRILPVGRFLRKSKINELCQLWDVVRGEMSLVGPRPQMLKIHALYPPAYRDVLDRVRPGLTGVGSIVFRNEERLLTEAVDRDYCYKAQIVPYKAELEQWYVDHQSLWLDIRLLFWTLLAVVRPGDTGLAALLPQHLRRPMSDFDGRRRGD